MSYSNGYDPEPSGRRPRGGPGGPAGLHQDGLRELALPVLLGVSVAIVTYLVLFSVVVWVALARFDYDEPFGNGDALAIGLAGAIALGASCLLGATLSRRRAQLRDVTPSLVRWAALVTGLILALAVLLLGFAPALRAITAPIYLVAAIGGTWLGATLGTERR